MSKKSKASGLTFLEKSYMRCPWCQRNSVRVKRHHLVTHDTLAPEGRRCVGSGSKVK